MLVVRSLTHSASASQVCRRASESRQGRGREDEGHKRGGGKEGTGGVDEPMESAAIPAQRAAEVGLQPGVWLMGWWQLGARYGYAGAGGEAVGCCDGRQRCGGLVVDCIGTRVAVQG